MRKIERERENERARMGDSELSDDEQGENKRLRFMEGGGGRINFICPSLEKRFD